MKEIFTTIENQIRADGSKGLLYDHFEDESEALAKHFATLSAAAKSGLPFHEAVLLSTDRGLLERRAFDRRAELEPEQTGVAF